MVVSSEQDAQTTGDRLIIVLLVVVFAVMTSLLAVGLRIWCRRKIRVLGWDDFVAVMTCLCIVMYGSAILALIPLGLSDPSGMLPSHKISNFYKCSYIIIFLYSQALFCAKMAFVLLYYRIVSLSHWRWTYIAAITFLVVWNVSVVLFFFLQCTPMATIWDPNVVGKCVPHQMELVYLFSGISIFTDIVVAILPLPVIWKLNLRRSQKIALSGIFLLACFSIVLSIIRVTWVNTWSLSTWNIVGPQLWGLAEVTSALICACVPTYKPLLVRLNAKMPRCGKKSTEQGVRHHRSDDEIGFVMDTTKIPPEVLDLGQRIIDILGPCKVSWTAGMFLCLLIFSFIRLDNVPAPRWRNMPLCYLVVFATFGYICLSLVVFYFSIGDLGQAYFLVIFEIFNQLMLMGTCLLMALVLAVIPASIITFISARRKGKEVTAQEALKNIKDGGLLMTVIIGPSIWVIFYLDMSNIPDLAIRITERDQLATLIVGIATLIYTILDLLDLIPAPAEVVIDEEAMEMLAPQDVEESGFTADCTHTSL